MAGEDEVIQPTRIIIMEPETVAGHWTETVTEYSLDDLPTQLRSAMVLCAQRLIEIGMIRE